AEADAILSVGGGASLDMGKAIRLLVHHDPPLHRYDDAKGGDRYITAKQPPFLAVPTTAGTGSEVGRSTVLVIDGTKVVIFSPHLLADAAILDPELTVLLPPFVTAATGMDALTHNLEAYVAKGDHPLGGGGTPRGCGGGARNRCATVCVRTSARLRAAGRRPARRVRSAAPPLAGGREAGDDPETRGEIACRRLPPVEPAALYPGR